MKYKTVGKTRTFIDHNGKKAKLGGGDYGWQLDYEKTLAQTKKALKKKISQDATDAYIADQSENNKSAITLKKKVIYANTGFKKDYVNFNEDWDPDNYIEISIADQKVYFLKKGKVKATFRPPCTGQSNSDRCVLYQRAQKSLYFNRCRLCNSC